jgi:hypothetical protein
MFFLILLECGNDGYKNLDVEVNRKIEIFNKSRVNRALIISKTVMWARLIKLIFEVMQITYTIFMYYYKFSR